MALSTKRTNASSSEFAAELGRCVVLFDLDGTLMDSETARMDGWKRAIQEIKDLLVWDVNTAYAAYQAIYNCHAEITGRVGPRGHVFEDMRQEWNTRISYALLIALTHDARFPRPAGVDVNQYTRLLLDLMRSPEDRDRLLGEAEYIADLWNVRYLRPLDKAIEAFWDDNFSKYLFPGVEDTLRQLRKAGIEYYVASEGHLPTQWRKISALGLDKRSARGDEPLVSPGCLLTTGQAAYPRREMQALEGLMEWYRSQAAAGRDAIRLLTHGRTPAKEAIQELNLKIASAKIMADGVARIRALFDRLARKFNVGTSGQVQPEFYKRVVYAVNLRPGDPREALAGFDLSWNPSRSFRLAMVGDRFESDIEPILALAERSLMTKVLAVWVRQGRYGQKDSPKTQGGFVACDNVIDAASKYLLQASEWQARTEPITLPGGLFSSAIVPSANVIGETLEGNVTGLIVGVGAARNVDPANQELAPESKTSLQTRKRLVDEMLQMIVKDIIVSPSRSDVLGILSTLCKDKGRLPLLQHCAGYRASLVEIFIEIASGTTDTSDAGEQPEFEKCFEVLLGLLDVADLAWASAVVRVVSASRAAKQRIFASHDLADKLLDRLEQVMKHPDFAAIEEATTLCVEVATHAPHRGRHANVASGYVPPEAKEAPPGISRVSSVICLGHGSPTGGPQQSVLLGQNAERQDVFCRLGGGEARNVVCICGGVGSGKSNTLKILIKGALTGETAGDPPLQSSVLVFHPEKPGPSDMVEAAETGGRSVMVFTTRPELPHIEQLYREYRNVVVKPLLFRLDQLPEDILCRLMELPTAAAGGFRTILQRERSARPVLSIPRLISAVQRSALEARQIGKVIDGLRKIESIVASQGEASVYDEISPGSLAIVDCGRGQGTDKDSRLSFWTTLLSGLSFGEDTPQREWLLVFDEFHHAFAHRRGPWGRWLSETTSALMKLGRHARVSMIAASQSSSDFSGHDFTADASVLLIHKIDTKLFKAPPGVLWGLAAHQPPDTFRSLERGQAWYCSEQEAGPVRVKHLESK